MQGTKLSLRDEESERCYHGCQCRCHYQDEVIHLTACCLRCLECGKDINTLFFYEHLSVCHGEVGESD